MKTKAAIRLALLFSLVANTLFASVTIPFTVGEAYTAGGVSQVAPGTIGVLVADTTGSGIFAQGASLVGANLSVGEMLGDSRILGVISASDLSGLGDFGFFDTLTIGDALLTGLTFGTATNTAGSDLGFYWFPGITTAGGIVSEGQEYGFFRSDTVDSLSGSEMSFNLAENGSTNALAAFTTNLDGSYDPALFQANSTAGVAGIPEPSRMILAMLGFVGLMFRRRR